MINICYCVHIKMYNYLYILASSIASVLNNTNEDIIINIFHDETFIDEYRCKFIDLVAQYKQKINFYFVDKNKFEELLTIERIIPKYQIDVFTLSTFYRLMIWKFLDENIEKCIYLDIDTIVNLDISTLFNEQLDDYPLGAIPEFDLNHRQIGYITKKLLVLNNIIPVEKYFNAGILLFNLKIFKQHYSNFLSYSLQKFNNFKSHLAHQDLLNIYFYNNYKHLDSKYNIIVRVERHLNMYNITNGIYHYTGSALFKNRSYDVYDEIFMDNFSKTNFLNFSVLKNILNNFSTIYEEDHSDFVDLLNFFRKTSTIIFFDSDYENFVKGSFNDIPMAKITIKNNILFLTNMLEFMNESKETTIVLFTSHYNIIRSELAKRGIVENKNFIDGLKILDKHDEKINFTLNNIFYDKNLTKNII